MTDKNPYTNRDLARDYLKVMASLFPDRDTQWIERDAKIAEAITRLDIDLPAMYRKYGHIPKLTNYGFGPIARRAIIDVLEYGGPDNLTRLVQADLMRVFQPTGTHKKSKKEKKQTQKSKVNIDALVEKFIADSGITGEFAGNIKQNFVSGINRMYQEIVKEPPVGYRVDYALPVKIVGADANSYAVHWAAPYGGRGGVAIAKEIFVHDISIDRVYQARGGILPQQLSPAEHKRYKIDELIGFMEKADFETRHLRELKKEFTPEQLELAVTFDQDSVNLLLTKEQTRNIIELCRNSIRKPKFKEVEPDRFRADVVMNQVGLLKTVSYYFSRMRRK